MHDSNMFVQVASSVTGIYTMWTWIWTFSSMDSDMGYHVIISFHNHWTKGTSMPWRIFVQKLDWQRSLQGKYQKLYFLFYTNLQATWVRPARARLLDAEVWDAVSNDFCDYKRTDTDGICKVFLQYETSNERSYCIFDSWFSSKRDIDSYHDQVQWVQSARNMKKSSELFPFPSMYRYSKFSIK